MLTYDDVVRALKEVVAERSEYFEYHGKCTYSPQPGSDLPYGCAVGGVIQKLDPEAFAEIVNYEERCGGSFSWSQANLRANNIDIDTTPAIDTLLFAFQAQQDCGIPYGAIAKKLL